MEDADAYLKYPQHRKWFNKLWLSELMGYRCGPCSTEIPETGRYVVRPIYNLAGMGVGAEVKELEKGDYRSVPAGYFWCDYIEGKQYSVNYRWQPDSHIGGSWIGINSWEGFNTLDNLSKFIEWKKTDYIPTLSHHFKQLGEGVTHLNVEFINDKPIEVHLRLSPDPDYDHMIPVWASDLGVKKVYMETYGFEFINAYDDANGELDDPRIGFLVK
mgnify:CR=1 FL=1